jgi:hypothetical protein
LKILNSSPPTIKSSKIEFRLSQTLTPENQLRFLILSVLSSYERFFIVMSKLGSGSLIWKSVGGSINALSQEATKGHLKHIFFSTMFNAPLMALAFVTT